MGVHGLWRLIEPSGKPVPLETLENKVLAVDISIWLHQAVKGFQDSKGAPLPNAHLLGIYHRVCKLLYFKIKPVFVFDGGVPALKKQTIARRNQLKSKNSSEADRLQKQLLNTLLKHTAISNVLSEKTKASLTAHTKKSRKNDNLYELPPTEIDSTLSSSDEEEPDSTSDTTDSSPTKNWDLHTIDMSSVHFKSLPVDVRHEILTELKETRKQNSWGRLHELPKQSDDFSSYQMKRLLKRQSVQAALDEAAKEMGGASLSLAELESILKDQGIQTTTDSIGKRIASDENTRYLFIRDVKQAMERARKEQLEKESKQSDKSNITDGVEQLGQAEALSEKDTEENPVSDKNTKTKPDLEEEEELQKAIALSLEEVATTSSDNPKRIEFSFLENFNDEDFQSESDEEIQEISPNKVLSSAQHYMMEYSGLTPNEISKIITGAGQKQLKSKMNNKIQMAKKISPKRSVPPDLTTICEQEDATLSEAVAENSKPESGQDKEVNIQIGSKIVNEKAPELTSVCEIMSDSGESSCSNDFVDVCEDKVSKNSLEIVIDPSRKQEEDDLFGDIFKKEEEIKENDGLTITIQPQLGVDDDLFSDIFKGEVNKEEKPSSVGAEPLKTLKESSEVKNKSVVHEPPEETVEKKDTDKIEVEIEQQVVGTEKVIVETEKCEIVKNEEIKSAEAPMEPVRPQLTFKELSDMKDSLQQEKTDLLVEKSTKERLASNISDQMYQEAQELLELFGLPYVIAPMEAEAQCAFLDEIELTDGTITDDSDIWLFGGRTVYKNFFNQSKYVMEFKAENIKHHFKLSREQMILLALLVGSDYTTGIQGVGPVTALEILAAFPPSNSSEFSLSQAQLISGLKEFRSWFSKGKSGGPGRASLKSKLKNITFTDNFPSLQVIQAYLAPEVETSKDKFSWGKPDVVSLTLFAREKFGWGSKKTDEILNPVIKRLEENHSQKSIKEYFKSRYKVGSTNAEEKMSKRVKTAIGRFGKTQEELIAEEMLELEKQKQKATKEKSDKPARKSRQKRTEKVPQDEAEEKSEVTSDAVGKKNKGKKRGETATETKVEESKANENSNQCLPKRGRKKKAESIDLEHVHSKIPRIENQNTNDNQESATPSISSSDGIKPVDTVDELKEYENLAAAIRMRRKKNEERKSDLMRGKKNDPSKKKTKVPSEALALDLPKNLEVDEDIQFLAATTSRSLVRVEEIQREVKNDLERNMSERKRPSLHNKEVIHQRLRDKTDSMKNKLKAIEVFRKSKKGPGFVRKRTRTLRAPKEDAGLSEDSE